MAGNISMKAVVLNPFGFSRFLFARLDIHSIALAPKCENPRNDNGQRVMKHYETFCDAAMAQQILSLYHVHIVR